MELDHKEGWAPKNWCFWTVVLEKTLKSLLDCKGIQPVHPKGDQSWIFIGRTDAEAESSNTLATWCEGLTHWKTPWCWERLKAGGEGNNRGWDSWMASLTQWTWVWVSSGRWWRTGKPGMLQSMGSKRVGHGWVTAWLNNKTLWSVHCRLGRIWETEEFETLIYHLQIQCWSDFWSFSRGQALKQKAIQLRPTSHPNPQHRASLAGWLPQTRPVGTCPRCLLSAWTPSATGFRPNPALGLRPGLHLGGV